MRKNALLLRGCFTIQHSSILVNQNKATIEICGQSITSAIAAQEGGANRIELCTALEVGGLTPSAATIVEAKRRLTIDICVLIRPRAGDFLYSDIEFEIIKKDILFCKEQGIQGVVVGILKENKEFDIDKMRELAALARPMQVVCHRAFDQTPNGFAALEQLIELGYDRVLTCGQAENVVTGKDKLKQFVEKANGRISIMPGNGVTVENIADIISYTQVKDIHLTAKELIISRMKGINDGLFGIKDSINNNYYETSLEIVKQVVKIVNGL